MTRFLNKATTENIQEYREPLLRILITVTFLIFFQAYMVAPLIPHFSQEFKVSSQTIGLIIPAYLIPYGIGSLIYGSLSDYIGRRRIMVTSLLAFVILTSLTAISASASQIIFWRFLTGLCACGVIPLTLTLIGDLFPSKQRGRPLGWIFGGMAGGMACGSTFGALLEPLISWRGIFLGVGILGAGLLWLLLPYQRLLGDKMRGNTANIFHLFTTYRNLMGSFRGLRTYSYVLLNGIFHSGVYTWLGLYFQQRYGLGETGIGLALLGYGVPGFLLSPMMGKFADRWGRSLLIPIGFAVAGIAVTILIFDVPLLVAALGVTILSLGYDMTQPLLAGIVISLDEKRGGQAMGLNVFTLFIGFGSGSFLFGELLKLGFGTALGIFAGIMLFAALMSIVLFRSET